MEGQPTLALLSAVASTVPQAVALPRSPALDAWKWEQCCILRVWCAVFMHETENDFAA